MKWPMGRNEVGQKSNRAGAGSMTYWRGGSSADTAHCTDLNRVCASVSPMAACQAAVVLGKRDGFLPPLPFTVCRRFLFRAAMNHYLASVGSVEDRVFLLFPFHFSRETGLGRSRL